MIRGYMIFRAASESDLKTTSNHVKNQILSKIRFLWYFDLKFPLWYYQANTEIRVVKHISTCEADRRPTKT